MWDHLRWRYLDFPILDFEATTCFFIVSNSITFHHITLFHFFFQPNYSILHCVTLNSSIWYFIALHHITHCLMHHHTHHSAHTTTLYHLNSTIHHESLPSLTGYHRSNICETGWKGSESRWHPVHHGSQRSCHSEGIQSPCLVLSRWWSTWAHN